MKERNVKFLDIDGERLAYVCHSGGEQTFLLIHGNMSSSVHWYNLMDMLEADYSVYAPDLRGFGDSSYNCEVNSLKDFAEDLRQFVLKLDLKKLVVVGWSTGGGVAMELAVMEDIASRIEKVILVESVGIQGYPILKKDDDGFGIEGEYLKTKAEIAVDPVQVVPILVAYERSNRNFIKILWNSLIYNLKQPPEDEYEKYVDAILKQRNLVDVDYALVNFNMTQEDTPYNKARGGAEKLREVLILQGAKDLVVPLSEGEKTKRFLGDAAKLEILEDVGHSPITDNIDLVYKKIKEFVGGAI